MNRALSFEFGAARIEQKSAVYLQIDLIAVEGQIHAVGQVGIVDHAFHFGDDGRLQIFDRPVTGIHAEQILDHFQRLRIASLLRGKIDDTDLVALAVHDLHRLDQVAISLVFEIGERVKQDKKHQDQGHHVGKGDHPGIAPPSSSMYSTLKRTGGHQALCLNFFIGLRFFAGTKEDSFS